MAPSAEAGPVQPVDESPTPEELETLPRVCDKIPYTIFFVVVAEVAERFTYRSLTGPMRQSSHLFIPIVTQMLILGQKIIFRTRFMAQTTLEHLGK